MTDEKMIEELAVICCGGKIDCTQCFEEYKNVMGVKIKKRADHCQAYNYAEILYNAGYRKLPQNAVVIPEKIDEKTSTEDIIKIAKYNESVRKETAREIFDTIIKALEEQKERVKAFYGVPESVGADTAIRTVKELAKQYGVEVEE